MFRLTSRIKASGRSISGSTKIMLCSVEDRKAAKGAHCFTLLTAVVVRMAYGGVCYGVCGDM
jgi:hypothetical protein